MNSRPSSEFAADPVTTKPNSRTGSHDPVSPPFFADNGLATPLLIPAGTFLSTGNELSKTLCKAVNASYIKRKNLEPQPPLRMAAEYSRESLSPNAPLNNLGNSASIAANNVPAGFTLVSEGYRQMGGSSSSPLLGTNGNDCQQHNQYQQLMTQQALLNQLQSHMNIGSGSGSLPQHASTQQGALASLLTQQLHTPAVPDTVFSAVDANRRSFPHNPIPSVANHWPRSMHSRSSPASSPPASVIYSFPDSQGSKHAHSPHEERKHVRGHIHAPLNYAKGRPMELDAQASTIDKLRREVGRLQGEVDRLEKEVARQKALRETERIEFTDAKDRVRHSWAVDRDDFARVKSLLKTKNAEHHAQSGRLSQQLKEAEAINRGLKELCARQGIAVPSELEVSHTRRHSIPTHSLSSMPSITSSQISNSTLSEAAHSFGAENYIPSRTPSETSFDSDFLERLAATKVAVRPPGSSIPMSSSQPPSPVSPATAVMQMMHQLQQVLPAQLDPAKPDLTKVSPKNLDKKDAPEEHMRSEAAIQAAAHAANALSQLAAALSSAKLPGSDAAHSNSVGDFCKDEEQPVEGLGQYVLTDTNLNRMSLQSWVKPSDQPSETPSEESRSCSPSTASLRGRSSVDAAAHRLAHGDGTQFSLSAHTCNGHPQGDEEEMQMWPTSPISHSKREKASPEVSTSLEAS